MEKLVNIEELLFLASKNEYQQNLNFAVREENDTFFIIPNPEYAKYGYSIIITDKNFVITDAINDKLANFVGYKIVFKDFNQLFCITNKYKTTSFYFNERLFKVGDAFDVSKFFEKPLFLRNGELVKPTNDIFTKKKYVLTTRQNLLKGSQRTKASLFFESKHDNNLSVIRINTELLTTGFMVYLKKLSLVLDMPNLKSAESLAQSKNYNILTFIYLLMYQDSRRFRVVDLNEDKETVDISLASGRGVYRVHLKSGTPIIKENKKIPTSINNVLRFSKEMFSKIKKEIQAKFN